jgi:NADH dehydrogenase FAD-containing subunit
MGGGPVGVEMAGEMVTDFPDKKVKIHFLTC